MGRPGSPIQLLPSKGKDFEDQEGGCCSRHMASWGDLLRLCRAAVCPGRLHRKSFYGRCTANTTSPAALPCQGVRTP